MHADKKSLKGFYRTKSINEEISHWSQDERKAYIDWHKNNDTSQSDLLKKKLNLVKLQYLLESSRKNASQNSAAAQSAPQENNDIPSLKAYSETADIKQQISSWDPNRLNSYIQKHQSEVFKSYLLRKKLRLARERAGNLHDREGLPFEKFANRYKNYPQVHGAILRYARDTSLDTLLQYIEETYSDKETPNASIDAKIIEIIVERGLKEENGKWRKRALTYCTLSDKQLKRYAPKAAREHDSGVYLWKMGYNVEKLLEKGGFSAVWKVGNKAVKVVLDDGILDAEVDVAEKVHQIISAYSPRGNRKRPRGNRKRPRGNRKKGARSYLNAFVFIEDGIFEAPLANYDLRHHIQNKANNAAKAGKTIRSLLRKARQILKGVKILHDAGYSHCDIKPENLLQENTTEKKQNAKIKKGGKAHKHKITVADFGSMSAILSGEIWCYTNWYNAPDFDEESPEMLAKYDVYSIGATLVELLVKNEDNAISLVLQLQDESIKRESDVGKIKIYTKIKKRYPGTNEEELNKFLWLLKRMVAPRHQDRLSVDEALKEVVGLYNAHYKMALKLEEDERKEPE